MHHDLRIDQEGYFATIMGCTQLTDSVTVAVPPHSTLTARQWKHEVCGVHKWMQGYGYLCLSTSHMNHTNNCSVNVIVVCMEGNRIPKRVLYMNLGTTRLRGKPRNRWQDEVREDGRIVGGEGWQEKVHNRGEWKKLLRTARNCRILHMPME